MKTCIVPIMFLYSIFQTAMGNESRVDIAYLYAINGESKVKIKEWRIDEELLFHCSASMLTLLIDKVKAKKYLDDYLNSEIKVLETTKKLINEESYSETFKSRMESAQAVRRSEIKKMRNITKFSIECEALKLDGNMFEDIIDREKVKKLMEGEKP